MSEETTCRILDCGRPAVARVTVDVGERWDEHTLVADAARLHDVPLCADHYAYVADATLPSDPDAPATPADTAQPPEP